MFKYFRRRKKRKLYQQWVDRANLSPDAIPDEEPGEDRIVPQTDKQRSRLTLLYILLGLAAVVVCVGLILLLVSSC